MAKIITEQVVINLSQLVKDGDEVSSLLTTELLEGIIPVIEELINNNKAIVELTIPE
jgi:hypothetical protein